MQYSSYALDIITCLIDQEQQNGAVRFTF